jgi:glycosyltransferase involved in cell wall biosynthesis
VGWRGASRPGMDIRISGAVRNGFEIIPMTMKVSVTLITYNHENFIRQALDSVLMQEVDFDYEIVIGEDFSTDNTRKILLEYQERHPGKLRLLLAEKNQGLVRNFMQTYRACKGQYVATLDGDDYWVSPRKLQMQVDFLDHHKDYALCFHPVTMFFEGGDKPNRIYPEVEGKSFTIEDILSSNFIPTCSVMFRNHLFGEFPDWYRSFRFLEDWTLYVLIAQHGKIGFLKEPMGVYRFHPRSTWSTQDEVDKYEEEIRFYHCMQQHIGSRHESLIRGMLDKRYYRLASLYEERSDHPSAKIYFLKSMFMNPYLSGIKFHEKMKMCIRLYFPVLYKFMKAHGS